MARQCPLWVMCGRRLGKNFLTLLQHWSGAVMCPAYLCGGEAAGHNAQTGSPDPRIDLVCITSSCPRQFLQGSTFHIDSGFTSFVARISNATTIALRCRRAGAVHSIISGHSASSERCPLYLQKQTSFGTVAMSALCQKADIQRMPPTGPSSLIRGVNRELLWP
jgi:hypothetical protein